MNANESYSRASAAGVRSAPAYCALRGPRLDVHLLQLGDPTLSAVSRPTSRGSRAATMKQSFGRIVCRRRRRVEVPRRLRDVRYEMGGRAVSIAAPRRPMVHLMSQVDAALLRARLYAWRLEEGAKAALEHSILAATEDPSASNVMLHKAALHLEAGRNREGWGMARQSD